MEATKEVDNKRSCWSDLPYDILGLIEQKLFGKDRICFRCTCKAWRSMPSLQTLPISLLPAAIQKLPVLFMSSNYCSSFSYFHPLMNTTYTLEIPELHGADIRLAKDGWLLMSRSLHSLFFFNPFTREKIELPQFPYRCGFQGVCFSSPPTSSDCMVMGMLHSLSYFGCFQIFLLRHGQEEWKLYESDNQFNFNVSLSNPIFHDQVFYCLGTGGNLGVFDPKEETWTILAAPNKPCSGAIRNCYLTEHNGEIFSLFEFSRDNTVKVCKLNKAIMTWQEVNNLGERTIFVSRLGTLMASSKELQNFGFKDKVFFPRFNIKNGVFYSLGSSRFHSFDIPFNRENFYETTLCAWIEPMYERQIDSRLNWYN